MHLFINSKLNDNMTGATWSTLAVFLLLFLTSRQNYVTAQDPQCQQNLPATKAALVNAVRSNPEMDVIILLDRSKSVYESQFEQSKVLLKQLLSKYYVVHPSVTRLTIITYAIHKITAVDHILSPLSSCEILDEKIIENLKYNKQNGTYEGSMLPAALKEAENIYRRSDPTRMENRKKVLWIFSDGESTGKEIPIEITERLKRNKVVIFTVGLGKPPNGWLTAGRELTLKQMASNEQHYACLDQWQSLVVNVSMERDTRALGDRVWHSLQDKADSYCPRGCDGNRQCFCNATSSQASCTCPVNFYPGGSGCLPCPKDTCKFLPGLGNCTNVGCPVVNREDVLNKTVFTIFGIQITIKWLIIALACLLALIILLTICCVWLCLSCRKREPRDEHVTMANGHVNMSTLPMTMEPVKKRRPPPPPPKSSQAYLPPPDGDDVIYGTVELDRHVDKNEVLHQDMEGWVDYMTGGVAAQTVSGLAVASLDGEQWCRTPGFKIKIAEFRAIGRLFDPNLRYHPQDYDKELQLQGKKYVIHENNGTFLEARGPIGGRSENIVCAAITGDYVIVGKSPAALDRGQCKAEVLHVLGHFQHFDTSTMGSNHTNHTH